MQSPHLNNLNNLNNSLNP